MLKNKKLSKAIARASWTTFKNILKYKCLWYNRDLIELDTYFPSSKLCSNCGNKKKELKLSDRIYNCENCGFSCDRDINAAINLVNSYPTVKNTESYSTNLNLKNNGTDFLFSPNCKLSCSPCSTIVGIVTYIG